LEVSTIAEGVHLARTGVVNWVLLVDGSRVALIDCGYPRQFDAVVESLRQVGRRLEDVEAVLVTHAHVDHIGALPALVRRRPVIRVLTGEVEARHVRGETSETATPLDVLRRSYRPRMAAWGVRVAALGGTTHPHVAGVESVPFDHALDLPLGPVPLSLAGHTSGHTAYHLPDLGVLATGDALVSGHPTTTTSGPQLLESFFHHDVALLREGLGSLDVPAGHLLPGHGPALHMPVREAVAQALGAV
jgi:glyoxylase-like metal-dependent hydrolase (beta-lactamase superfamily II)